MFRPAFLRDIDYLQITAVLLLLAAGLTSVYSATSRAGGDIAQLYEKQLIISAFGLVLFITAVIPPHRFFYAISYLIYIAALLLLGLVLAASSGGGPARWFDLGLFNLQPSEIAKLAVILALARFLDEKKMAIGSISVTVRALLIALLPAVLVIIEPDLGTAAVFPAITIPMMIMGGVSLLHLLIVAMPVAVLLASFSIYCLIPLILIFGLILVKSRVKPFLITVLLIINLIIGFSGPKLWNSLHPYQQKRILSFVNPEADPHGAGYQVIQSKVAVGSGGLWGKGYLKGTQGYLRFLPAGHTDFIFSIYCEERGFAGAALVVLAFFILVYRGLLNADHCRSRFSGLVIVGGAFHFTVHALINIGMTTGLLPVTGLPLPFMSYGGSAMLLNMTLAGIMVGLSMRWKQY